MPTLYLDESGDEGFKPSSSEWFILAGALHKTGMPPTIISHYDAYRAKHRKQDSWYFHFQGASHSERRGFIKHMGSLGYTFVSVAIHKRSLRSPENFQRKYFMYFYATRLLLESATYWVARNDPAPLHIYFSNRKGLSIPSFVEYLDTLRHSPFIQRDHVHWNYIRSSHIHHKPNRELIGLQMADCFASSVGSALEINEHDMTECCYARQLLPQALNVNGTHRGYGVKMWPLPADLRTADRFSWYNL